MLLRKGSLDHRVPVLSNELTPTEPAPAQQGIIYKSRVRTEPTNVTAPQWAAAIWARLESLVEELADCCVKVFRFVGLKLLIRLKQSLVGIYAGEGSLTKEGPPYHRQTSWKKL